MAFGDRQPDKDINLGSGAWEGAYSNGTTIWFLNNSPDRLVAYKASDQTRDSNKDFTNISGDLGGAVSDGITIWLINKAGGNARAYNLNSKLSDSDKDIRIATIGWQGGTSDGTTLWLISEFSSFPARAYRARRPSDQRPELDSTKNITLGTGAWRGGASDGTTLWFVNSTTNWVRAYVASSRARDEDKDISLGSGTWRGGATDGKTLWLVDSSTNYARAFEVVTINLRLYIGTREIKHIYRGTTAIDKLYRGDQLVWERGGKPTITSFTITPNSINLDHTPTGNITIAFTATAGADGSILRAFVTEKSTGRKVGLTYASAGNAPITQSFTIPQPDETEIFVLTAVGNEGSVHQEAVVTVVEGGPNEISAFMTNPDPVDLDTSPTGNITLSYATKGKRNRLSQGSTNIPVLDTLQADSAHDITLPSGFWRGCTSDGFTIWALQSGPNYLRAYNALSGHRDTNKDISLGAGAFVGCVYNQGRIWVTIGAEARAYSTNTYSRDTTAGMIALGSGTWTRAFSDDVTLWFINDATNRALAWNASTLARDSNKDLGLGSGGWDGSGQSDTAIYLLDRNNVPPVLRAYTKQDRQRRATKDFNLPQQDSSNNLIAYRGLVGAGGLVFMLDDLADKLLAFKKVEAGYLSNKVWPQKTFTLGTGDYRGACTDGLVMWVINATTSKAEAWQMPTLRAPASRLTNRDITLLGGGTFKGLIYADARIWVIDNTTLARCYESGPGIRDETRDLTHGYTDAERGISDGSTLWIVRGNRNAEAFNAVTRSPDSTKLIRLPSGNYEGGAIYTGPSFYFVNRNAVPARLVTYNASTRARQASKDFGLVSGQAYRGAVSVGRLALFINNTSKQAECRYLDADFSDQTIPQPSSDTSYRLDSLLGANSYNASTTIQVNKSPEIANFRRVGFQQSPGTQSGTFFFSGTIRGTPQPALTYKFGNGRQGTITARHLTPSGTNEWTFTRWSIFHSVLGDSLEITATNRKTSTTTTIANIST